MKTYLSHQPPDAHCSLTMWFLLLGWHHVQHMFLAVNKTISQLEKKQQKPALEDKNIGGIRINLHLFQMTEHQSKLVFLAPLRHFGNRVVFYAADHEMPRAFLKPLRSFGYFNCSRDRKGRGLLVTNSWESLERTHYCSNVVSAMPPDTWAQVAGFPWCFTV